MKRRMKFPRRLYYPVGLISLILLPVFCIVFIKKEQRRRKLYCMEVNVTSIGLLKEWKEMFGTPYLIHPDRKFIRFEITGDDDKDKLKLDSARMLTQLMILRSDTTHGIQYHFNDEAKYWTWVYANEPLCLFKRLNAKEKGIHFIILESDIWIFIYKPPKSDLNEEPHFICGTPYMNRIVQEPIYGHWVQDLKKHLACTDRIWPGAIVFILMIVIAVERRKK